MRERKRRSAEIMHHPGRSHVLTETTVPDKTLARNRRKNTGFRSANQVEVDFISWRAIRTETVALADRTKNCDLHGKV